MKIGKRSQAIPASVLGLAGHRERIKFFAGGLYMAVQEWKKNIKKRAERETLSSRRGRKILLLREIQ